ncbi:MAG: protein kinase, partial [Bradymonadaceae bacterium]
MASSNSTDSASGGHVYAGRFEYQKPLGKGAGGSVYLAEDLHNEHRRVGLKVLSADQCEGVEGKMLRREFEILSKLDHPHLVRVYDYGTLADGGVYLAEEYIDGASLQDVRALLGPDALIDVVADFARRGRQVF